MLLGTVTSENTVGEYKFVLIVTNWYQVSVLLCFVLSIVRFDHVTRGFKRKISPRNIAIGTQYYNIEFGTVTM